jgi:hypothetical protein
MIMKQKKLLFIISLLLGNYSYYPSVLAQSSTNNESIRIHFISANSHKPDTKGTPPTEQGTGSRGDCPKTEIPLMGLVGSKDLSLTVSEYPTFYVYIPYTSKEASGGEFELQDEKEIKVYQTPLPLPTKPSIISIRLPSNVQPLQTHQKYRWYLTINCRTQTASNGLSSQAFVTGQIERILATEQLNRQLKMAKTPLERLQIYAENGIWYDTLTELANLAHTQSNWLTIWQNLLIDMGFQNIAQVPLLK